MAKNSNKRSSTGHHPLLPASRPDSPYDSVPHVPAYHLVAWTLGRGSVIWRIWPAVLLHTAFAALIVILDMRHIVDLEIPNVMLTVLGVVIGFVISYRAISGYDRYWMGRTCWSEVIRNSRTLGRLVWFHVPPRLTAKTPSEIQSGKAERSEKEFNKVMAEKRMALDLIEGFAFALKHHIRGELGIYYEDLYHLVRPMHDHNHTADEEHTNHAHSSAVHPLRKAQRITARTIIPGAPIESSPIPSPILPSAPSTSRLVDVDPVIPPINAYGTFDPAKQASSTSLAPSRHLLRHSASQGSALSNVSSISAHRPLMPSTQPPQNDTVMDKVDGNLIPFAGTVALLKQKFSSTAPVELGAEETEDQINNHPLQRKWQGPVHSSMHMKRRPKVAGGGESLPLEILRCLSEWFSVLEDRGTVPGTSLGSMIGCIAAFEDSLSALERILTTPLPFVYAVHIRHTVWVYLFFLPFQLVGQFGYYTIPGVAIAAFIYLGFLAAGEEIEQPFGYDDNDLDLDLFCNAIIHADISPLKSTPCLNAYFGPETTRPPGPIRQRSLTLAEIADLQDHHDEGPATGFDHE